MSSSSVMVVPQSGVVAVVVAVVVALAVRQLAHLLVGGGRASTKRRAVASSGGFEAPFRTIQGDPISGTDGGAAAGGHGDGRHATFAVERLPPDDVAARAKGFREFMDMRRSVRFFSRDPVPLEVIQECIRTAGTAPSGAHLQPWTFAVVRSKDAKAAIRAAVEAEETKNYETRMRKSWVKDVNSLVNTLHKDGVVQKPYLEDAPYLIIVMKKKHDVSPTGERIDVYYPTESVGIAVGILITALHNANLVTLTSTPMGAEATIRKVCGRPDHEKVFLLMPVGYAADDATVPYRTTEQWRKPMADIMPVV